MFVYHLFLGTKINYLHAFTFESVERTDRNSDSKVLDTVRSLNYPTGCRHVKSSVRSRPFGILMCVECEDRALTFRSPFVV